MRALLTHKDGTVKLGVQITNINDFMNNYSNAKMYVRKFNDYSLFTTEKMREIHEVVYDKPYDINPRDWVNALFVRDNHPQQTNSFWCSAFKGLCFN